MRLFLGPALDLMIRFGAKAQNRRGARPLNEFSKGDERMSSYVLGFQDIDKTNIMCVSDLGLFKNQALDCKGASL